MIRVLVLVFALAAPTFQLDATQYQKKPYNIELNNSRRNGTENQRAQRDVSTTTDDQNQCGKVVIGAVPVPLIASGSPTFEGQWPWHVALYQTQNTDNKYICGGTLVSRRHVITAAHCVTRRATSTPINKGSLIVSLGKQNLETAHDGAQLRFVEKITVHPDFNSSTYLDNLAIIELREPVSYTDWVRPVCLWPENEENLSNIIGKKGSVVGWGFDETGMPTKDLNLVEMPVVDQETCIRSYSEFFSRFTSDKTYCAGSRDGKSVCNGDSGGGMVFKNSNTWYLRGMVSVSIAKKDELRCDPTHYVIFTDTAKFLPWIKQNISDL